MIETRTEPKRMGPDTASTGPVTSPWTALVVMVAALSVGALLNAESIANTAAAQPAGPVREVAVAVSDGLADLSEILLLDRPRRAIDTLRSQEGESTPPGDEPSGGVFVPTPDNPARLRIVGDSLVDPLGAAVVTAAETTGVIEASWDVEYSSGLTRPELMDWHARLDEELSETPIDILVFVVGANDAQPIETGTGWHSTGTPPWRIEYRSRVDTLMTLLEGHVPTVYWIGQPIARSANHSANMALLNGIYRGVAESHPGVRYVDSWDVFEDAQGEYSAYLPGDDGTPVLMRRDDGIHLTEAGSDRLAAVVLDVIGEEWDLGGGGP